MSDTLIRQLMMLRRIPRHPRRITVQNLSSYLADQGHEVTERTVQRDLLTLSGRLFGLSLDDRSRPHGWCWDRDAAQLDIPGMEPQTALGFKLAEHFAGQLMAPSTLNTLGPYFRQAEQVLNETPGPVRAWPEKVQTISRGQSLIPPLIDQAILHTVYEGLFNDCQITARYERRYDGAVQDYMISPLGIVFRDGVVYLVCQRKGRDEVIHLAMHRFINAQPTDTPIQRPQGFELANYVREGGLDFRLSDTALDLVLKVDAETAVHLEETPLSANQAIARSADGRQTIRARVADTAQIRWWIMGLGNNVEVIEPSALRTEIQARLERAAGQYQ